MAGEEAQRSTLWGYIRPYRGRFVVGLLLVVLTIAGEAAIPLLFGQSVDGLSTSNFEATRNFALYAVGLAAALWLVRTLSRIVVFNVGRDLEFDLRNDILQRIHTLGTAFFARMKAGDIMSRAVADLGQIRLLVGFAGLNIINSAVGFVVSVSMMMSVSPRLTLISLSPFLILVIVVRFFSSAMFRASRRALEASAALTDFANEHVAGMRLVRTMGMAERQRARFNQLNDEYVRRQMTLVVLRGVTFPVMFAVASIGGVLSLWVGVGMVMNGELTIGRWLAFDIYLRLLIWPTIATGFIVSIVQRGRSAFTRVREILDADPDVAQPSLPLSTDGPGAVAVNNLSYEIDERRILAEVTFSVAEGASVAILGPTGSGKSTLAALLPRLLPTPPEAVRLDGTDVTRIDLRTLRKTIGYAQQDPFLFSTTVEGNLKLGLENPDAPDADARIRHAAEEACVLDEIESMPDGFRTVVGERGVQLSGGQKQRISLARALLNQPKVLVLDDPMSAVDAKTEKAILDALDRAKAERTFILITNRVAAAARTDRILVLEAGRIVDEGTHSELLARGGLYAQLASRQEQEAELQTLSAETP